MPALPQLAALFGGNYAPGSSLPLSLRPSPAAASDDDEEDAPAVKPIAPVAPVTAPAAAPTTGRGNVLAMLPSALKAQQDAAAKAQAQGSGPFSGLGGALAAGADAGAARSKIGAFASGFAHGLKALQDNDTAQAAGNVKAQGDTLDRLMKLFDAQSKSDSADETSRHNLATEANTAKSTENLGAYYKSIAEKNAKEKDTPDLTGKQGYQRDLTDMYKNAAQAPNPRAAFIAAHRKGYGVDPDPSLVPAEAPGSGPSTAPAAEKPGWFSSLFGGGKAGPSMPGVGDAPAPAAPPASAAPPPMQPRVVMSPPAAPQVAPPVSPPADGSPVRVTTPDEARKLPSGTLYVAPDGVVRKIP